MLLSDSFWNLISILSKNSTFTNSDVIPAVTQGHLDMELV